MPGAPKSTYVFAVGIAPPSVISDNIRTVRKIVLSKSILSVTLLTGSLIGQTPAAAPLAFEVASIKPSQQITPAMVASGKLHVGMKIDNARVDIGNFALMQLICKAYDVKQYQVSGPSWLLTGQKFDIVASLPQGASKEQVPEMLQSLLAERFKLTIHRNTKEVAVYAMVVGKGGLKMKEVAATPVTEDADTPGDTPKPATIGSNSVSINQTKGGAVVTDGEGTQQKMSMSPDGKSMHLEISRITAPRLAEALSPMADRPIVDLTELKGKYEVVLDISMQDIMNAARAAGATVPAAAPGGGAAGNPADSASDPGGSLFTAIQSLGLKLEPRKSPLLTIVVDSVEKMPTGN
jgi:uncharacterized protein (TIGR03435 family)